MRLIDFTHVEAKICDFSPLLLVFKTVVLIFYPTLVAAGLRWNIRFTSDIFDNQRDGSNLQNFPRKLGSAVFLKVQGKSPSKSTFQSLRRALDLLWQITEGWIDKTHLHCSEMAAALTSKGFSPLQGSHSTQETASNGQKCA